MDRCHYVRMKVKKGADRQVLIPGCWGGLHYGDPDSPFRGRVRTKVEGCYCENARRADGSLDTVAPNVRHIGGAFSTPREKIRKLVRGRLRSG